MSIREWRERVRGYAEITDFVPIARRYFIIGAFDGVLTILGGILGAAAGGAGPEQSGVVIAFGIGAGLALGVSSTVGAYEAERIQSKLDQYSLERAMLREMGEERRNAFRFAAIVTALVHGISPLIAGLLPVLPFVFLPFSTAVLAAVVISLAFLFGMGVYLGSVLKERALTTGLRFVIAGIVTALLVYLLGGRL